MRFGVETILRNLRSRRGSGDPDALSVESRETGTFNLAHVQKGSLSVPLDQEMIDAIHAEFDKLMLDRSKSKVKPESDYSTPRLRMKGQATMSDGRSNKSRRVGSDPCSRSRLRLGTRRQKYEHE